MSLLFMSLHSNVIGPQVIIGPHVFIGHHGSPGPTQVKLVELPQHRETREPRGFAFVEFGAAQAPETGPRPVAPGDATPGGEPSGGSSGGGW